MATLGFVGLGAMGGRLAGRLLAAGHGVYGWNRTRERAGDLIERGLRWRDTPREVAEAATVVFSMVTDDRALQAVTNGPDGVLAGLDLGSVYVDMSTVSPAASADLAARVAEMGAAMLDAPVSGSTPAAEQGLLTIMVGGDHATFERVEPLLRELGQTVTYVGGNGRALMLKLAINISLAVQMIGYAEGVLLAEAAGIEPELAVDVLTSSAIGSPMLKSRGPLVLGRPDEAWFDVDLMDKDIALVLDEARRLELPLPSAALAGQLLTAARALGYGEQDMSALFDVLADMSGRVGATN